MGKKFAVFDIDGTIFRSSLLVELVDIFIERNLFPANARKGYEKQYRAWIDRKGNYEDYIMAVVAVFEKHLKGVDYEDFLVCSEIVRDRYQNKVYRYTRDLVRDLKKKGYFLLAISQSPKGTLDPFCTALGFDKVYGRRYELGPSDKFNGKVEDLHIISNKANTLKRAIEKEGLTLDGSIAVGDTEGDIAMLEMVERPICFNPNELLYTYAKRMGWEVVVERKDVIYNIQ